MILCLGEMLHRIIKNDCKWKLNQIGPNHITHSDILCQKDQNFYNKSSVLLETHDENEIRVRIQKYTSIKILCIYIRSIRGKNVVLIVEEFLIANKNINLHGNYQRKTSI